MNGAVRLGFSPWEGPDQAQPPGAELAIDGAGALRLWTTRLHPRPVTLQRIRLPHDGTLYTPAHTWYRFRVPYPQPGPGGTTRLILSFEGSREEVVWPLTGGHHRPPTRSESSWTRWSERLHDTIRRWEELSRNASQRTWENVAARWEPRDHSRQCRRSLIVRLSETLPRWLREIAHSPRVRLQRQREMRPLDRASELDAGCIRWLSLQPGTSLVQRAGPRQRVLAVVRKPDYGTLENRITADVLRRCVKLAQAYQVEHRGFVEQGERTPALVEGVRRFQHLCRHLLRISPVGSVPEISGAPRANYVLTQNTAYREVWKAWLAIRQRQQEKESLWEWQDRLWADFCRGLLAILLLRMRGVREFATTRLEILPTHAEGGFVPGACWPSPLIMQRPDQPPLRIDILAGKPVAEHAGIGPPDLTVKAVGPSGVALLHLWTLVAWNGDSLAWAPAERLTTAARQLGDALERLPDAPRGLLLIGAPEAHYQERVHPRVDMIACPFEAAGADLLLEELGPLLEELCAP